MIDSTLDPTLLTFSGLYPIIEPGQFADAFLVVLDLGLKLVVDLMTVSDVLFELGGTLLRLTQAVGHVGEEVGGDRECWSRLRIRRSGWEGVS